ncbi:MAG: DUF4159 domain-containing protein [Alphaproteobacteria bacterium]|nr:DUF4159 domain-containing protein [Alphaproteobacteria bacterium]
MTWGPITFGAPLALWALASLPVLFLILRATPPAPQRRVFPPLRLLLGLQTDEQSRERAPLWLVLLRALMCALAIIGFARPSLTPEAAAEAQTRGGRTLIVIDDGWTSAPFWAQARAAALDAVAEAERGGGQIFVLHTAPARIPRDAGEAFTPGEARGHFNALEPQPWRVDRAAAAGRIQSVPGRFDRILWIANGLDDEGAQALASALTAKGAVTARMPARTARAVVGASVGADGVTAELRRAQTSSDVGAVTAETAEGRSLGAAEFRFTGESAIARIDLPPEIAARTARVRIVGEDSAGAVRLMPGGAARPTVGLVDPGGQGQPLLSDLFYVDRALSPYASLRRGDVGDLVRRRVQAMVLADASRIAPADRDALTRWIERGGVLIRFAGPRLANDADDLLPVRLRPGSRTIGGALAWERPQHVRPFAANSPFAGLAIPEDVAVRRQVLAEPSAETESRVWARLEDGAPVVTAQAQGRGLIVLYHVTAGPAWSDLPLSGLYVEMLRRTIAFAGRGGESEERPDASGPYVATRLMDGFGALSPADADAAAIDAEAFASARAGPAAPPGFYERAGIAATLDAAGADERLAPLALPSSIARAGLEGARVRPLSGLFLGAAAALLALDLLLSLWLAGRMPRLARAGGAALAIIAALILAPPAFAQDDPTLQLHLAYVRTGDAATDRIARDGLEALTETLRSRTTVEPEAPIGVDLARDDLSVYPFIYWPAPPAPRPLSNEAVANLDRYLRLGGMVLVDTRDAGRRAAGNRGPAAIMLAGLDAPPLEPIDADHVLARSFYLLRAFPGRASAPRLWGESAGAASARDGVASLFVGDGDWAAAWASEGGSGLSGGPRQRELSLRFGVNLVMVALTGNYKEDQVHVPALLERLGRERR